MPDAPSARQLAGLDESHLVTLQDGHRLMAEAANAFQSLRRDALDAGFELAIASAFRSCDRQLAIWNGKAGGTRPVYDDEGDIVDLGSLSPAERVEAILRYSALPAGSRHHWGTDLDVYDAASVPEDYVVQLSPQEVSDDGVFGALHRWLDERMAAGQSHGFYRPYARDRGGVAPERWHLSYAPIAQQCETAVDCALISSAWDDPALSAQVSLRDELEEMLPAIFERFVRVPRGWCPRV